jgi:hypothetical protein
MLLDPIQASLYGALEHGVERPKTSSNQLSGEVNRQRRSGRTLLA